MRQRLGIGVAALVVPGLVLGVMGCDEPTRDDQIADTMHRTESIRGLTAKQPVPYRFLPADEAFDDMLDEWRASDAAVAAEAEGLVMQRLGLLPVGFELLDVLEWSTRTGVLGYYDPETAEMTVITDEDEQVGPGELMVLAHEHAHALQDQHFGLDANDELDADEVAAIDALTEGEATLVMAVWTVKRLGIADIEAIEDADVPTDYAPVGELPPLLYRAGEFPYVDGAAFVFSQWDGDWEAVDALWKDPPRSTEQVMHPERYPDDAPVEIVLPDVAAALGDGWEPAHEMVMGEMQIGVLLADGVGWGDGGSDDDSPFEFPRLENAAAAEGWGGDRLVHVTGPDDGWAVVWQTTWDRAIDAIEFTWALGEAFDDLPFHASVRNGVDVTGTGLEHPVLVTVTPDMVAEMEIRDALAA